MGKKDKVTSTKKAISKVKNSTKVCNEITISDLPDHLYKEENLVVDFCTFETAFLSCDYKEFNNYLQNEKQFVEYFRKVISNSRNLQSKTPKELFNSGSYRHCHKVIDYARFKIILMKLLKGIGRTEKYFEQMVGGEDIYQIGIESGIRIFGIMNGNILRVCFIDYNHTFEYNQTKNKSNKKGKDFCIMTSEL